MKMTKVSLIAALALGGLLVGSTAAMAQEKKEGEGKKGRGFMSAEERLDRMTKELKLTDEQKPKVKVVLEDQDKKFREARDSGDREKFRQIREDSNKKLKEILTADQYKQYEENMARRGPGGGGGKKGEGKKEGGEKKN